MNRSVMLALLTLALATAACEGAGDTTSGREVNLRTSLVADSELDRAFDTETGWSVRLNRAAVSIGSLYYFEGGPAFARRRPRSAWQRLAGLLGPRVARAHPGHYAEGDATGQMTTPSAVELRTSALTLPDGRGVTGRYRSGRFVLADAKGGEADGLEGHVALAEGVATKDDLTVYFRLRASLADLARSVKQGQVNGCVFDEAEVQGDGTVTVRITPSVWFNLVDFSGVAPGSAGEPTELTADETPRLAFALGVVQLSAYRFSFQRSE